MTPFLDLILSSPHASLEDVAQTLREAYRWLRQGCEIGMYPYVIPFSGAALARIRALLPHTHYARQRVAGTDISWDQPVKILPIDPRRDRRDTAHGTQFRGDARPAREASRRICRRACARCCGS